MLWWALLSLAQEELVESGSPRYRLRLPPGYALQRTEGASRFWAKDVRPGVRFVVTLTHLDGAVVPGGIPRRRAELWDEFASQFPGPPPPEMSLRTAAWQGRSIDILELRRVQGDLPLLASMAFLPTVDVGVRLEVLGPSALEPEVTAELHRLLDRFQAPSWWLRPDQERFLRWFPWVSITPLLLAPAYFLAWLLLWRRRPQRHYGMRTAWMWGAGLLALLPPLLWPRWMDDTMTPPPGMAQWPLPLFVAAPWLMLASVRLLGPWLHRREEAGAS